ncbi:MAG: hypothetical protein AB1505_11290 [Candidatus Latescibacterota bacterium]
MSAACRGGTALVCLLALAPGLAPADVPPAGVASEPGFCEEGDPAALEDQLADQGEARPLALRWRLRGDGWDGGSLQAYQRLEWRLGEGREVYLLAERDPGEPRWPDFAAFYLAWQAPHRPLSVVAGDLLPGWGAGLVFGRASGPASLPLTQPGTDSRRVGYRSAAEMRSLRGVWVGRRGGSWSAEGLLGQAWRDGRLGADGSVTSLPEDGIHVTRTEREGRRLLRLRAAAGRLRWTGRRVQAGLSLLDLGFDRRVDLRRPERKPWAFAGGGQVLAGADAAVRLGRLRASGEAARDRAGHGALVGGVRLRLPRLRLRAVGRWYDPGYQTFFGGAASRGGMENERGLMVCAEGRGWQAFTDRYRRPERTYYYPLPARVRAWGAAGQRGLGKTHALRLQLRQDAAPRWTGGAPVAERTRSGRLEIEWRRPPPGPRGTLLRLRLEERRLHRSPGRGEGGRLASLLGRAGGGGWRAVLHLSGFLTDSYATRIYEYEYDLPGTVTVRPLYGRGWRLCALLSRAWAGGEVSGRYRLQRDGRTRHHGGLQVDLWMDPLPRRGGPGRRG